MEKTQLIKNLRGVINNYKNDNLYDNSELNLMKELISCISIFNSLNKEQDLKIKIIKNEVFKKNGK